MIRPKEVTTPTLQFHSSALVKFYEGIGVRLIHDDLIEEDSFLQLLIKGFIRDLYAKHLPQFVIMISEDAGIVGRIFVSNGFVRRSSPP